MELGMGEEGLMTWILVFLEGGRGVWGEELVLDLWLGKEGSHTGWPQKHIFFRSVVFRHGVF